MNSDEVLELEKQTEETDVTNVDGFDIEETIAMSSDPSADAIATGREEMVHSVVGGDGGEEEVEMVDAGGTVEVPEATLQNTSHVETNNGDTEAATATETGDASANHNSNQDSLLAQQESDSKADGQETIDMRRARGDEEDDQPRRKRIRRVGMTPVREIPKTEEGPECHDPTANGDIPIPILAPAEDLVEGTEEEIKQEEMNPGETKHEEIKLEGDVKLDGLKSDEPVDPLNIEAEGSGANGTEMSVANVVDESKPVTDETKGKVTEDAAALIPNTPIRGTYADGVYISSSGTRVLSKHDQKWLDMLAKLVEYIKQNGNTAVPQCYHDDPQLGRWVHYQRVEYWIYQQTGSGKITDARINRLNSIGFEWNPQQAQWDKMFTKLKQFKEEIGHCRVPKGYSKDPELANWVRNQRLEQANFEKKKKSRMTPERHNSLNELGFKWSAPTPSRSRKNPKKGDGEEEDEEKEDVIKIEHINNATEGSVLDEAVATAAAAAAAAVNPDVKDDRIDVETEGVEAKDPDALGGDEPKELEVSSKQDPVEEEIETPSSVDKSEVEV